MKNIIIGLFIFLTSCGVTEQETYNRYYTIENNTEYILKIKSYFTSVASANFNSKINKFLNKEQKITEHLFLKGDNFEDFEQGYYTYLALGDSAVVIFDNKKILKFRADNNVIPTIFSKPIDRNLFDHFNYENLGNEIFLFKITQEDYENAEDCNGNCE